MADRETREALALALVCQRRLAAALDEGDLAEARELVNELGLALMAVEDRIGAATPAALFDVCG